MLATLCLLVADEALGQRFSTTIYQFMSFSSGTSNLSFAGLIALYEAAGVMLSTFRESLTHPTPPSRLDHVEWALSYADGIPSFSSLEPPHT